MKGNRRTLLEPYMCGFHEYLSGQGYSEIACLCTCGTWHTLASGWMSRA
jgi:hypothetical protein